MRAQLLDLLMARVKKSPQKPAPAGLDLQPGQSIELLKALHILTSDGHINQDSRRKLKQVMHLYQFVERMLLSYPAEHPISVVDHGAGKSYLGFLLYDLFFRHRAAGQVYGIETRTELVAKGRALAAAVGFERFTLMALSVQEAMEWPDLPAQVDVVTALHACDTATDDAIAFGLRRQARHFALVPCCQAELARCLNRDKALSLSRTPLAELWRHPLHTREFGSQLTNVLRCLHLEACGYQVTVTELVGWEHSMKNELILATYTGKRSASAAERLNAILNTFGLEDSIGVRYQLP